MGFGVSGLALWVAGIPLWVFCVLREERTRLGNLNVRAKFGFLFNGYAPRSYFWELVSLVRKALVGAVSVFLVQQGSLVQAYLLLLVLFLSLLLTLRVRPYHRPLLNAL